jgi:hypothetical protein
MTNFEPSTLTWLDRKSLRNFPKNMGQAMFHVLLVALSAGIAIALPFLIDPRRNSL